MTRMVDAGPTTLLQLCPNDHPPFLDICALYQAAAAELGRQALTVFFGPARGEPMAGAVYLDQQNLRSARRLGDLLTARLGQATRSPLELAVCHRYRALEAFRHSALVARQTLCVVHEFGFFRRRRRRLRRALMHRQVRFAGVSAPVVAELKPVVGNPVLLPNGIDLARQARARLSRAAAQRALGLRQEDFNIGVIGRLHPKKQPQLALAGFAAFAPGHPKATLSYLGDGELRGELQAAARGLRVNFAGFVEHAARFLPGFDVVLIPSSEREAFNMVALEAMAAGVPVVAGPAPGPRFVLADAGLYFSAATPTAVAHALSEAQGLGEARSAVAEAGRFRADAEFSVAATGRRLQAWLT